MKRRVQAEISAWVSRNNRKPMVLLGPRQVGKTWLMKQTGNDHFETMVYINFERDKQLADIFTTDFDPLRILKVLEIASSTVITPGKTLVILDEIQEAAGGLTALKYFFEEIPELHILAAGSLLGVGTKTRASFPVGKVELMHIHPLDFREFLSAIGEPRFESLFESGDWQLLTAFHEKLIEILRSYYIVGGMPEAVQCHINGGTHTEVRRIQEQILMAYERDFSKHAPVEVVPRIRQVWDGFVGQLAKENKKFIYGLIRSGARAREYEAAIGWLLNYGLAIQVNRATKVERPLKAFVDSKSFKLYFHDVGLLAAMARLDPSIIVTGDSLFGQFKGALTEQFVVQQFVAHGFHDPVYWDNPSGQAEVDFIFEGASGLIPLEVKAADNLQSKSLKVFYSKHPKLKCYRTSLAGYRQDDWLTNVPLYALPISARNS